MQWKRSPSLSVYLGDNESSWLLDDTPCIWFSAVDRLIPLSVALLTRGGPGNRNDLISLNNSLNYLYFCFIPFLSISRETLTDMAKCIILRTAQSALLNKFGIGCFHLVVFWYLLLIMKCQLTLRFYEEYKQQQKLCESVMSWDSHTLLVLFGAQTSQVYVV